MIKAFLPEDLDDLPGTVCSKPRNGDGEEACCKPDGEEGTGTANGAIAALCDCLKTCPECDCCGDAWVLLGCVRLGEHGIQPINDDKWRKHVKPIECVCAISPELQDMQEKIRELEEQIGQLTSQSGAQTSAERQAKADEEEPPKPADKPPSKAATKSGGRGPKKSDS